MKIFSYAPNLCPYNTDKLQSRSLQCVFLGYSLMHKDYKCFHVPTSHLYISRDILFKESVFPFTKSSFQVSVPPTTSLSTGLPPPLVQPAITRPCSSESPHARDPSLSPNEPPLSQTNPKFPDTQ